MFLFIVANFRFLLLPKRTEVELSVGLTIKPFLLRVDGFRTRPGALGIDVQVQQATVSLPEVCLKDRRGTFQGLTTELKMAYTAKLATDMPWLINAMKITGQALGETFHGALRASIQATQTTHSQFKMLLQEGNLDGDRQFQEFVKDMESRGKDAQEYLHEAAKNAGPAIQARTSEAHRQLRELPEGLKEAAREVTTDATQFWTKAVQGDVARDVARDATLLWEKTVQHEVTKDVVKDVTRLWEKTVQGELAREVKQDAVSLWEKTIQGDVAKDIAADANRLWERTFQGFAKRECTS